MKLSPAQAQDDLAFWLNQDREHNLFYLLGFAEPELKKEAERIYQSYDRALRCGDLQAALAIVPRAQAFKDSALAFVRRPGNAGRAGYIWPSFIEHTKMEIDAMVRRSGPGLTTREEVCLGDRMLADHAAFASSLLDPIRQAGLADAARAASRATADVANRCATETLETLVTLSRKAQADLDSFMQQPTVGQGAIIHPLLADHVVREGRRFGDFLSAPPDDERQV